MVGLNPGFHENKEDMQRNMILLQVGQPLTSYWCYAFIRWSFTWSFTREGYHYWNNFARCKAPLTQEAYDKWVLYTKLIPIRELKLEDVL